MRHIRFVALIALVSIVGSFATPALAKVGDVRTWLSHVYAGDGGDANNAWLDTPLGFTADSSCNLYIADTANYVVRKITQSDNVISTVMGNGTYGNLVVPSAPKSSQLKAPVGIVQSPSGNFFVSDRDEGSIRLLNSNQTNNRTVIKGLKSPNGLAVDDTYLYIAETGRDRILLVTLSSLESGGPILTSGSSALVARSITSPYAIAVDGSDIYVTAINNTSLYKIQRLGTTSSLNVSLVGAEGVTVYNHDVYFVTNTNGTTNQITKYHPGDGTFTLLQNVAETEWYNHNTDLTFCGGKMYILMSSGSSIYQADLDGGNPVKIAGAHRWNSQDGNHATALVGRPMALARSGSSLYILDNNQIAKYNLATQQLTFLAGHANDNYVNGVGGTARLSGATQMVVAPNGKTLYFADRNNNRIRALDIATKSMTSITGAGLVNMFNSDHNGYAEGAACTNTMSLGIAGCAYFDRPTGIAISTDGKTLYVADSFNARVRSVNIATGVTRLVAGGTAGWKDGVGSAAKFRRPNSLLMSKDGKTLYVVDLTNHLIRKIDLKTKRVTTIAGTGKAGYRDGALNKAVFSYPDTLAQGPGNTLFLSEVGSQRIRTINLTTKKVSTLTGSGKRGTANGSAAAASFNDPRSLLMLTGTQLIVADQLNDLIRIVNYK